jgi:hypothetical protein
MDGTDRREQQINEVVGTFRNLESGPAGGVLSVVLLGEGVPERVVGRLGFVAVAQGFTATAVEMMNELRRLEQYPNGRDILLEAYERWQQQDEEED